MTNIAKYLSEIHRVLTPKGIYIVVSYGTPENRLCYLEKVINFRFLINRSKPEFDWTVTNTTVYKPTISTSIQITSQDKDSPSVHYIYIC
jgi:ubiquinone/menaquinone biosynthesis C-methylase UbiE